MTAMKGLCVGATMLVPGVGGGTMAMLPTNLFTGGSLSA